MKSSFWMSAVALIAAGLPLVADSLTGKVVDAQGAVVANADVTLFDRASGNQRKTRSSATGEYSFTDITPGTYAMSSQGMETEKDIVVAGATTQDVTLSSLRSVVQIIVTATGTPMSSQEITKSVDVVDADQINARDEYSIGEVLRAMPGIQIQTQVGGVTQIRTRGLPNQYTAVLIDGMRFRDVAAPQADASGFIADMNVTDQSRVEFMRGSGSDLYGTNAVAGTINLNSNEGGGNFHGSLRAEGGGLGMARGGLNVAGGIKQNRFVYSGGATHINVTSGVRGVTPNRNSSGELFGKYYFTPKLSLSGRVWGSDSWQRSVVSPAFPAALNGNIPATGIIQGVALPDSQMALYEKGLPYAAGNATFVPGIPDPDGNRASSFDATAFILRYEATANTSFRASYQRVNTRRTYSYGPAGVGSQAATNQVSNNDGNSDELQLRFDNRTGRFNQFTGGYEFEGEYFDSIAQRNQIGGTKVRTTAKQESHSIYGQDQVRLLNDRLLIVFGGRIQYFSMKTPSFTGATSPYQTVKVASPENAYTGDVSISYFVPSSSTKFRAHVGNGYRAPALYERFGSGGGINGVFTYYGDPRLPSEKSFSFDGGIDQYFWKNKVRVSGSFFYTDLSQTIIFNSPVLPDPFGRSFGYVNSQGGGIARGFELSGQISPTRRTSITASYTFNNAETRAFNYGTTYDAVRTARHIGSLVATQWITSRLSVTADFYGMSDILDPAFFPAPSFATRVIRYPSVKKTDVVANYRFALKNEQSLDVYTKWENVFNIRYTDSGFLAPQAWGIAGVKWNF